MTPDDYLWDRSGEPDPEVERLEHALGPLGHEDRPLDLPARKPAGPRRPRLLWLIPATAAAAALIVVAVIWLRPHPKPVEGWDAARVAGEARIGSRPMRESDRIPLGEWLETGDEGSVRVQVGGIGIVDVGPLSRVRVNESEGGDHRLTLERGELRAVISAPPRQFSVETPAALAVDLGCVYTLRVRDDGSALLAVELGWVSLEAQGRESFIPAGAECLSLPGRSPGTPCMSDAPETFKRALHAFDFGDPVSMKDQGARTEALGAILVASRREDALTLWHLLSRTKGGDRGRVYDALAARVAAPDGVTREGILQGDAPMYDAWWDALGFGDTSAWRRWRRPWSDVSGT